MCAESRDGFKFVKLRTVGEVTGGLYLYIKSLKFVELHVLCSLNICVSF